MIYPWSCGAKIAIQTDASMCLRKFLLVTHQVWRLAVEHFITKPTVFSRLLDYICEDHLPKSVY